MPYLTIPLVLALVAVIALAVVVWRKMSFLRKLTPESHEVGQTWLHDMAPEVIDWYNGIPWHQYRQDIFVEFEKFLRRIRLMFSAVDRLSEQLVHKARKVHQESAKQVQVQQEQIQAAKEEKEELQDGEEIDLDDPEQLKAEEQRLIVAIAQSPKDASLYSDLARVYMKMRSFADAVEVLEAAVKLVPENADYQRRLESARRRLASQQETKTS